MLPDLAIVWFKRDLRLRDHEPLRAAIDTGLPVLLLYCFEPSLMRSPDSDLRHWRFVWECLTDMERQLAPRNIHVAWVHGEAADVLETLHQMAHIRFIFSHIETGNALSFERDKAVAAFCQQHDIEWCETPTGGVTRRLYHRKDWEKTLVARVEHPIQTPDFQNFKSFWPEAVFWKKFRAEPLPTGITLPHPDFQPGGETPAWRYLESFLYERGRQYFRHISKPEAARRSCSRISPYLTWGCLSVRQVWKALHEALDRTGDQYNLSQFRSRLFWQSHFIQKFEAECRMEFENLNRGFDLIRTDVNPEFLAAWEEGRTGIPLIDACMRCVTATGYLNFRMRSMLVSFLTHHLWQPWQAGAHHLARQFLDYEPGIHYSQFQMQAGTMGVNTLRIYNPVKQSLEHDPEGVFLKKWLPELAHLPLPFIHEPWKMTALEQGLYHFLPGEHYPQPIVDLEKTGAYARDALWAHKNHPAVQKENARILRIHTKRRSATETTVMGDTKTVENLRSGE